MLTPSPAHPLSLDVSRPQSVEALDDADLMHLAVYGESPSKRDAAIRAFGRREFTKGMKAANQVHSFINDKLLGGMLK